jgi:two-component system cell cycle sensor histidine kinase/response regulator CckA
VFPCSMPKDPSPPTPDAYRELFERSADAILIIEGETFIDCNDATVKMLRHASREDVLRTHPSELSPPTQPDGRDSYQKANEIMALAFERGSHRFEWAHVRADGEVFPVEVLLTALKEHGRRRLHVVWRDITERKALEEQLRHAQKMEAIGELAGGIAHDFNNLLVVVQGHADLLGPRIAGDRPALEHLERIKEAGNGAAALVQQLLAFGRKQQITPRVLDLDEVVSAAAKLLNPLLADDIELTVLLSETPIAVKADKGQLEQIFLNLATNARDAMPRGGSLAIGIRKLELSERFIGTTKTLEPGHYGIVTVTDTGTGMTRETIKRAFEPFFTTKDVGEGTGLGLSTVYGIVSQCGGEVSLSSGPGSGTTVEIYLPVTTERPSREHEATGEHVEIGGTETILVVEDEPVVSELIVESLRSRGYTVLVAGDGRQGVDRFLENADSIALILTDVMMPRMSGVDLVLELSRAGHDPAVLFMSGYADNALGQLSGLEGEVDLIKKPFELTELTRRIRGALDQAAAR